MRYPVVVGKLLFAALVAACGASNTADAPLPVAKPIIACQDFESALREYAGRCGFDAQAIDERFLQNVVQGGCEHIGRIRDEASLRRTCLPLLASAPCDDNLSATHDASCDQQFIVIVPHGT